MTNLEQPVAVTREDQTVASLMYLANNNYYRRCEIAARHRIAAEQAQKERDARKIEKEADAHAGKWSGMDQREIVKSLALIIREGDDA